MSNLVLPEVFRTAEAKNVSAVYNPIKYEGDSPKRLGLRRSCASALGSATLKEFSASSSSWTELEADAHEWIDGHLSGCDFNELSRLTRRPIFDIMKEIRQFGHEGISTSRALIEVTPKVLFKEEFDDPNEEIAEYAMNSLPLLMDWAKLSQRIDPVLAYALSETPKPKDINNVFGKLRFNPKWFQADNERRRIVLNDSIVQNLRGPSQNKSGRITHPANEDVQADTLFGCPMLRYIPPMYRSLVSQARDVDLLGRTYAEDRRSYGYVDEQRYMLAA